jgi:hypothetical protein
MVRKGTLDEGWKTEEEMITDTATSLIRDPGCDDVNLVVRF